MSEEAQAGRWIPPDERFVRVGLTRREWKEIVDAVRRSGDERFARFLEAEAGLEGS